MVRKGLRRRARLLAEAFRPPVRRSGAPDGLSPEDPAGDGKCTVPRAPRLVDSPVFVLSPVRSGSTLLRVLLNSHSQIRAPHEMHLRTVQVRLARDFTAAAMRELQLDKQELEHILWDRVLHLELERSGKRLIVDKTPANTLAWQRVARCWPNARFLFLRRHPAAVVGSLMNRRDGAGRAEVLEEVTDYAEHLEEAGRALPGLTVAYEELTAEPERVTREICDFLGVPWEPGLLEYGRLDHGPYRPQLGDWSGNIMSGRIQPARPVTAEENALLTEDLRKIAARWGYRV
ncbi:sulfotransferase family protein [Streptomyces sp. Ru87]|uniref:Sulfotransferase n=2 Tax=Streptomyces TaxID=1883 RepID=A0ABQ7FEJ2_9ACTN|nr:sulfotransferase [Streptomyces lycii]PGH50274.1 sulfotransferase family protein [Streptomyces sp. Ru87]